MLARLDEVLPERQVFTLHYALCDSPGDMALVEYLSGRAEVNCNPQPGVLTNTGYMCSVAYARSKASVPTGSLSRSISSLDRFALAERLNAEAQATACLATVDDLFRLRIAALVSCLFFGLLHWTGGLWYMVLTGVVAGGVFAGLGAWRRNTLASYTAHLAVNLIEFLYIWLWMPGG